MAVKPDAAIVGYRERITALLIENMRALDQYHLELTAVWAANVASEITRELKRRRRNASRKLKKETPS